MGLQGRVAQRVHFPQLAALNQLAIQRPSFPHALSGNPGESGSGPPIKTFGGDGIGIVRIMAFDTPQLAAG